MNRHKNILSIDFSLNGSAMIYGNIQEGIKDYFYFSNMKKDSLNEHCIEVNKEDKPCNKLDNVICKFLSLINKVDFVVLESASFNSLNSTTDFHGGYHIFKYLCRRLNIELLEISPISNKLFFTGNSKADKKEMIETAVKEFGKDIDFENISSKHTEDIADALSLYLLGETYLRCYRMPAPKGYCGTSDIKPVQELPLHRQQVIYKLYNRDDLYKEIVKLRSKYKK